MVFFFLSLPSSLCILMEKISLSVLSRGQIQQFVESGYSPLKSISLEHFLYFMLILMLASSELIIFLILLHLTSPILIKCIGFQICAFFFLKSINFITQNISVFVFCLY